MANTLLAICSLFLAGSSALLPQTSHSFLQNAASRSFSSAVRADSRLFLTEYKNGNDDDDDEKPEDETVYFDDFDFVIGADGDAAPPPAAAEAASGSSPAWKNKLDERIKETQEQEIYRDTKLMQSWKQGDWSVRGFSLDPFDALSEATEENQKSNVGEGNIAPEQTAVPITVSKVVKDVNSDGERIWVGRSNGSLFWIQLGTEYTTHFRSKLSGKFSFSEDETEDPEDDDKPSSSSVKIGSELVRENMRQNPSFPQEGTNEPPPLERPFSILAQFSPANSGSSPISTILSVPDEDCVFTACKGSGQIQQWHISEEDVINDSPTLKTPIPLSDGIHNGAIVALKIVSFKDSLLLLSVGDDGTLALWDVPSADLVYHCQISLEDIGDIEEPSSQGLPTRLVYSADVNDDKIFLGTASGFVLGYNVADLMHSASSGSASCPLPQGKFKAHDGGVTAIACGGPGTLGRGGGGGGGAGDDKTTSCVLLTGGGNGVVKQWEILSSPRMQKMENWPKLPTQRLPKKAHLFEGHDAPITALESMSGRRPQFLSASVDGTIRAWDSSKGTESYRMDGFSEDLSSLCLQGGSDTDDDMLITNGMNQYVCVHDFTDGMGEESVDDYFEQWDD